MGERGSRVGKRWWGPAILVAGVAVACSGSSAGDGAKDAGSSTTQGPIGANASSSGSSGSAGASSSGAGVSSGGATSGGGTSSSGSPSSGGSLPAVDAGSCLGASVLGALGRKHLLVGGAMQDATAAMATFDLRYIYISGGIFDGSSVCTSCLSCTTTTSTGTKSCQTSNGGSGCGWWGCWQYDHNPPGQYVSGFVSKCEAASPAQIPMITYYQINSLFLMGGGSGDGSGEVTMTANNLSAMTRYYADFRFMLQQIGQSVAIVHIEPDFWGFAEQYATTNGKTATTLPAAVASANGTDCGSMPNTIAGMGQCMIAMTRKYAPHALVGLHASAWSTNMDVALNTSTTLDVAGEAAKTAAFLSACGESSADLVVVETSDRDADYYKSMGKNTWWDATNATLPDFHQDFAWVKALTEGLSKPGLYWQTPLGNANQNDTTNHWKDNRVQYFFAHMSELAGAHVIGAAFGAGDGATQTTPESDGGYFVTQAKSYFASAGGGQALCQ